MPTYPNLMQTLQSGYSLNFRLSFVIVANLKSHIKFNHNEENMSECNECGFRTSSRKAMKDHYRTHDVSTLVGLVQPRKAQNCNVAKSAITTVSIYSVLSFTNCWFSTFRTFRHFLYQSQHLTRNHN